MCGLVTIGLSADAQEHVFSLAGSYEAAPGSGKFGHGAPIIDYRWTGQTGNSFNANISTDTLTLRYEASLGPRLRLGVHGRGEALFAGLLGDYYIGGDTIDERGFVASYLEVQTDIAWQAASHHTLRATASGRRWFFTDATGTSDALVLPAEAFTVEPRLGYTFWDVRPDAAISEIHRRFWRVEGAAAGIELGLDWRDTVRPWGALDATAFETPDHRNDPDQLIATVRQWSVWGWRLGNDWRVQIYQTAGLGFGGDDLTRARVGGMHFGYVVPLAGIPWAGLITSDYAAAQVSLHVPVGRDSEVGFLADVAGVRDMRREGSDAFEPTGGVGLFADVRLDDIQIDLRVGYAPPADWHVRSPLFTALFGIGWAVDL